MRLALALVLTSAVAHADAPRPGEILGVRHSQEAAGSISHVIYMNSCLPNGCDVKAGDDDAANGVSSIPTQTRHLSAWKYGDADWQALVACVQQTYAPFDIQVVTERPTSGRYTENIVAGTDKELRPTCNDDPNATTNWCAGGVAPFIDCDGGTDNAITFTFANTPNETTDYLCATVAQETAHLFGLDHEMNADDPMTYLSPLTHKIFQNTSSPCGENANRTCYCGQATQNSYTYLANLFGVVQLDPPHVTVTKPADGSYVKPGAFTVETALDDQVGLASLTLAIDGANVSTSTRPPFDVQAPSQLQPGKHALQVTISDTAMPARTVSDQITFTVMDVCGQQGVTCTGGTSCVNNFCYPGASVPGGIGAACAGNDDCTSANCASDGTTSVCTDLCTVGVANSCPASFTCTAAGASAVCFPDPGMVGGCNSGGATGGVVLLLIGFMTLTARSARGASRAS